MPNSLYSDLCDVYDEGEKPYLYISYSHEDTTKVVAAIRALQRVGYRIWYDMGISAGAQWPEDVADHIFGCEAMLAFMTPNAIASDNCREELFYGKKLKKNILLAYLEECDLSHGMDMRLGTLQFIDRRRCKDDEEFYTRLAKAKILQPCRGEIEGGSSEAPAPAPAVEKPKTKIDALREKAKQGCVEAQHQLGWAYRSGTNVEKDLVESTYWFRQAAEQGNHAPSQFCLAFAYVKGWGVEESMENANLWYQKAADQGDDMSRNNLGWSYETGSGIEQDMEKAVQLYRLAAEQNNGYACSNLARLYENGIYVEQSWEEAVKWHRRAAELGMAFNQWKMADCCRKGLGVPMDEAEAARWQRLYDENPNK